MATLGQTIREARDRRHLSVLDLALRVGVAQSTISRLENDDYAQAPKPELAAALSRELGIPELEMLKLAGYSIGDDPLPYDALTIQVLKTTEHWTPAMKALLWRYVDAINEALADQAK